MGVLRDSATRAPRQRPIVRVTASARLLCNLVVLASALMVPLQLPFCVCASQWHSHADAETSGHHHHVAPAEQHGPSADASDSDHSDADPHAADPKATRLPTSDRDHHNGSHHCECSPDDVPIGPLPKCEKFDSPRHQVHYWMTLASGPAVVMILHQGQLTARGPPHGSCRNPLTSSQGNPCALLCRWVL